MWRELPQKSPILEFKAHAQVGEEAEHQNMKSTIWHNFLCKNLVLDIDYTLTNTLAKLQLDSRFRIFQDSRHQTIRARSRRAHCAASRDGCRAEVVRLHRKQWGPVEEAATFFLVLLLRIVWKVVLQWRLASGDARVRQGTVSTGLQAEVPCTALKVAKK